MRNITVISVNDLIIRNLELLASTYCIYHLNVYIDTAVRVCNTVDAVYKTRIK